jgi:hypothetical protein
MIDDKHSYTIDPRPARLGGGWRLRLLDGAEEVGGGVFPAAASKAEKLAAYEDAMETGEAWLSTYRYDYRPL